MSPRRNPLIVDKFTHQSCPTCGTPRTVVNGRWLRLQRERAGLTLREFAKACDVSAAYLCDIEHNRRRCLPKMREAYEALA